MSTQQSAVTGKSADCHLRRGVIHLSVRLSVCFTPVFCPAPGGRYGRRPGRACVFRLSRLPRMFMS